MRYHTALFLAAVCIVIAGVGIVEPRVFNEPVDGVFVAYEQRQRDLEKTNRHRKALLAQEQAKGEQRKYQEALLRQQIEARERNRAPIVHEIPKGALGSWRLVVNKVSTHICPKRGPVQWEIRDVDRDLYVYAIWLDRSGMAVKASPRITWHAGRTNKWPEETTYDCLVVGTVGGVDSVIWVKLTEVRD